MHDVGTGTSQKGPHGTYIFVPFFQSQAPGEVKSRKALTPEISSNRGKDTVGPTSDGYAMTPQEQFSNKGLDIANLSPTVGVGIGNENMHGRVGTAG